jgi:hypothetical protein
MTSKEWDEKYHKLVNYLNANPHIAATYPFMESIPGDTRDIIADLAAASQALVEYVGEKEAAQDRAEQAEFTLSRLREALAGLARGTYGGDGQACFCEVAIGNPMMHGDHSAACRKARLALAVHPPQQGEKEKLNDAI